jgi:hypothetical protein
MARVGYLLAPGEEAEWTFIVGRAFLAAIPANAPAEVVSALGALAGEATAEAEVLLALLPLGAERAVDSFAVIVQREATDDDGVPVSVIVRGEITVDVFSVGGSRRFTAGGIRPWLLSDFRSVTGLVIGSPGRAVPPAGLLDSGRYFPIGTVTANRLLWTFVDRPESMEATIIRAARPPAVDADTVLRAPRVQEDTVILTPGGHRARRPPAVAVVEPDRPARAHYGFRLPDGTELRLDTACRLGRHPRHARVAENPLPRLLEVASSTSAVSGTHLDIRQVGDSVVITDLGSTNGTWVTLPRRRPQRLGSGQSLTVLAGTRLDIGDGNIIEILPASGS